MKKGGKILGGLLATAAIAGLVIGIIMYIQSTKTGKKPPADLKKEDDAKVETETEAGKETTKPEIAKYFPLKKGSQGAKVYELQQAILGYNASLLPKYGADSDFGSETESAVKSILNKTSIDSQDDINAIITKTTQVKNDANASAKLKQQESARVNLANLLVAAFKKGNSDFYAITSTLVSKGNNTSDGRVINLKSETYNSGNRLYLSGQSPTFTIDSAGFITVKIPAGLKYMRFSPYGFEIKTI